MENNIKCIFHFEDLNMNRKKLFEEAIINAKDGKVLYVLSEELNELPQDLPSLYKLYNNMKMITFMYVKTLDSLLENISTLHNWQSVPSTIILDDLSAYCNKSNLQNACGVVSLLLNTSQVCSKLLSTSCKLHVAVPKAIVGEEYCNVLYDLYS
ncbi:unnamed protein product [Chrysodeixis includens]|uniref:Uncharacterized protein n=1 Tax=Chrysodeixis includens TaxID=689277 RepID=A0A9P0BNQ1_CHRIL|nr:unnamed protein product [Chrysodeixis includens]